MIQMVNLMNINLKIFLKEQIKNYTRLEWNLSIDLFAVLLTYLSIVLLLYIRFHYIPKTDLFLNFILFGVIIISILGVFIPISYHNLLKKRPLFRMGIKKENWIISLILSIIFGFIVYYITLRNINLPNLNILIPLIIISLAVGLFETLFFRGWLQLRFEEAFGTLPGVILGAIFYSFYHLGYGVPLDALFYLFILGIIFAFSFRITRNI